MYVIVVKGKFSKSQTVETTTTMSDALDIVSATPEGSVSTIIGTEENEYWSYDEDTLLTETGSMSP